MCNLYAINVLQLYVLSMNVTGKNAIFDSDLFALWSRADIYILFLLLLYK